jgi:DNA polymerase III sliding clamp (beta) subunit (PCNA family)
MSDSTNKKAHFISTSRIVEATGNLECVEVRRKDENQVYLTATNGHILAIRIEQGETSETTLAPPEVLSKLKKDDTLDLNNGRWENKETGKFSTNGGDPTYPNIAQVLPDNIEGYTAISFNADELYHLARALKNRNATHNGVVLLLPEDKGKPIAVLASGASSIQSFGLLMPMRIDGIDESDFNKLVKEYKQALNKGE